MRQNCLKQVIHFFDEKFYPILIYFYPNVETFAFTISK